MAQVHLADRLTRLRPTAVNRVLEEVKKAQADGLQPVSLMRGQPDTPTPGHIVEAAHRSLRNGRTGYAENRGEPALRHAVAEKIKREQGVAYDPDREILITDGATLGIHTALGAVTNPGGRVMLPDPIYDAYAGPIAIWGCDAAPVPASIRAGRFMLDGSAFEEVWHPDNGAILLNTPWNPVGTVLSRAELDDIMASARAHNCVVISDEIYESLVYDGHQHISPASLLADARERTIIVSSLSKTYAMTGWRSGILRRPGVHYPRYVLDPPAIEPGAGDLRAGCRCLRPQLRSALYTADGR